MKNNNGLKVAASLAMGLALSCANSAMANSVIINYASTVGSFINFVGNGTALGGGTFDFTPSASSFAISGGTANGFTGEMTGTYTIGAIVGNTALVTGSGAFTINNGLTPLTATLTWDDIYTFGADDGLNAAATANLTGISYAGSNPDLVTLASNGTATDALTFQFVPPVSLAALSDSPNQTSFSGSIYTATSTPDGGMTIAMLGGAMLVLGGIRRKLGC